MSWDDTPFKSASVATTEGNLACYCQCWQLICPSACQSAGVRSCNFLTSIMFVSKIYCTSSSCWYMYVKSVTGTSRSTSSQNRPLSAIPQNSVTRTCPPSPRQILPCSLLLSLSSSACTQARMVGVGPEHCTTVGLLSLTCHPLCNTKLFFL